MKQDKPNKTKMLNRFRILLVFSFSLIWMDCFAQQTDETVDQQIIRIEKQSGEIEKDTAKYRVEREDVFGKSSEGGVLEKYYDGNKLRKANLILYGEKGQIKNQYYFQNDELIFVLQTEEKYNSAIYTGKIEVTSTETIRFYFNTGRLVRCVIVGVTPNAMTCYERGEGILENLKLIK